MVEKPKKTKNQPEKEPDKKKSKKNKENNIQIVLQDSSLEQQIAGNYIHEYQTEDEPILKKRGRKPKGGKLISKNNLEFVSPTANSNVILHLKCSLKDIQTEDFIQDPLKYNPSIPPNIMMYDGEPYGNQYSYYNDPPIQTGTSTSGVDLGSLGTIDNSRYAYTDNICKKCNCKTEDDTQLDAVTTETDVKEEDEHIQLKDINAKLKKLRIQLYKNMLNDKKSACFWCTYEFDNEPCYIPKYEIDGTICGYGSFCRPECAVGFLMKENIDDSTKFERYQLLNQIYSKVYKYKKNIKPAPNPYYLLDKFYGNLSIQEYRKLLKTEHMLLVIDKPLTRILPELHDDNDEFILNIYGGAKNTQTGQSGGVYKVKRQSEKTQGPTKNSILRDKFGLGK